ncbi:hypothetical protein E2C01_037896 [Portunus trituberculatus]|uniref:Uncharacterized protein n=1 Tax=Portunus trituberculatus TaxID=210409 RepID=A0A5B7FG64_PORTR|nr:hypothetical protein [Portunus trituberculatus]
MHDHATTGQHSLGGTPIIAHLPRFSFYLLLKHLESPLRRFSSQSSPLNMKWWVIASRSLTFLCLSLDTA